VKHPIIMAGVLEKSGVPSEKVDEVIFGHVLTVNKNKNTHLIYVVSSAGRHQLTLALTLTLLLLHI